ncbi:hypothetical protein KFU94_13165 [Chloroflexi bacterium TSY]|nr:hypothetical protein [Chloroflexi bacterium TSY]
MNGKDALTQLGIDENTLTAEQKRELDEKGFFIVTDVFTPEEFTEIGETFDRLQGIEGDQGGHEVHTEAGAPRLSNILNKSTVFDKCLEIKPLLAGVVHFRRTIRFTFLQREKMFIFSTLSHAQAENDLI